MQHVAPNNVAIIWPELKMLTCDPSKQYENNWSNVTWGNMINPYINCMYMQFFLHKLPTLKLSLAGWGLSTHWSTCFAVVNHVSGPLKNKSGLHCSMGFYLHVISISFVSVIDIALFSFQIGDIVYARLCIANKDMEPELDCTDGSGKSTGLGQLSGGFMINCSLGLSRKWVRYLSPITFDTMKF